MSKKKKTLIIGASENPERYANIAAKLLLKHEHPLVLVGRKDGQVQGVPIHTEHTTHRGIDTVSLYINPTHQKEYYKYILSLKPKRVLFNPGTENPELYALLEKSDIAFEEACTLVLLNTGQY